MQKVDADSSQPESEERRPRGAGAHGGARLVRLDAGAIAAVFPIADEPLTIGRDPANPVFLADALASKRHASVAFHGRRLVIEDLNSLNGTRVNERRVTAQELLPGDVVRIGRNLYIYLVDGMPLKRSAERAAGWIFGRYRDGGGVKLPVTDAPLLVGRAREADLRVAEPEARDFHAQVVRVPGGVQLLELTADPPRCSILADGEELKIGATTLTYRAGAAPRVTKPAAPRIAPTPAAPPVAPPAAPPRAEPPPESGPSESALMRSLEAESNRVDRDAPRDTTSGRAWKCRITARNGPLAGRTFMFLGKRLTIGRDKKSKIHLDDNDVSRAHACIWRHEGDVVIEDLKSGNGVFVNGAAIRRTPLKAGDVIRIGSTEFLVHL